MRSFIQSAHPHFFYDFLASSFTQNQCIYSLPPLLPSLSSPLPLSLRPLSSFYPFFLSNSSFPPSSSPFLQITFSSYPPSLPHNPPSQCTWFSFILVPSFVHSYTLSIYLRAFIRSIYHLLDPLVGLFIYFYFFVSIPRAAISPFIHSAMGPNMVVYPNLERDKKTTTTAVSNVKMLMYV